MSLIDLRALPQVKTSPTTHHRSKTFSPFTCCHLLNGAANMRLSVALPCKPRKVALALLSGKPSFTECFDTFASVQWFLNSSTGKVCIWLWDICYCLCLVVLLGSAWRLLNKISILFSGVLPEHIWTIVIMMSSMLWVPFLCHTCCPGLQSGQLQQQTDRNWKCHLCKRTCGLQAYI